MKTRIGMELEIELEAGDKEEFRYQLETEWSLMREKLEAILIHNLKTKCPDIKITLLHDSDL
ncbi:MAG TPA: hypothetical protein VFG51_01930 [Candidatus Saccharimonadia bacterium]|nr:hypothetical protein [Candidatus Saccharimonadia bacterium]